MVDKVQHTFLGIPNLFYWDIQEWGQKQIQAKENRIFFQTNTLLNIMETSKDVYQAQLEVNMGPIQDLFSLQIRLNEKKSSSLIHLQAKGTGNIGEIVGNADLFINDIKRTTKLNCTAEAQVTGALALAGQRVIEGGANKGLESFFQTLEKEIKRKLYMQRRGR